MSSLPERWNSLAVRLSMGPAADLIRDELFAHYSESHRAYHNLEHLRFCFEALDSVRQLIVDPDAVELALWFHDVIYDPRAKDNEEQSAHWFLSKTSECEWSEDLRGKVRDLILATKHHQAGKDPETRLICDIDLAILGQSPEVFASYEKQIRQEYAWVEETAYRLGRSAVLKTFLQRPQIYATAQFQALYEAQARTNLQTSLNQLS